MKTVFRSTLALRTCVVTLVLIPTPAAAQAAGESFVEVGHRLAETVSGAPSSELRQSIEREATRLTKASVGGAGLQQQAPPPRSWAGRHPVALGVIVGATGGAIWGAAECHSACEGGSDTGPIMALGVGIGAAVGAGIGAIISLVRR